MTALQQARDDYRDSVDALRTWTFVFFFLVTLTILLTAWYIYHNQDFWYLTIPVVMGGGFSAYFLVLGINAYHRKGRLQERIDSLRYEELQKRFDDLKSEIQSISSAEPTRMHPDDLEILEGIRITVGRNFHRIFSTEFYARWSYLGVALLVGMLVGGPIVAAALEGLWKLLTWPFNRRQKSLLEKITSLE